MDCKCTLAQRVLGDGCDVCNPALALEYAREEIESLRQQLETERMRLAACGVVALANTRESAKEARDMHPDYWSASCGDVVRAVDAEMDLREQLASVAKERDEIAAQARMLDRMVDERDDQLASALAAIEKLERGWYICKRCGIRKTDDYPKADF